MKTLKTQAITFDAGGTLISPQPSVGAIYCEVAKAGGFAPLDAAEVDRQFKRAWSQKADFQYTREQWAALVRESFAGQLTTQESDKLFPDIFERFESPDAWLIHDDVLPALDDLAGRGFRLALISNWDERLRPLLEKLKLLSFFETVTISCEIGFLKPSPVIFEHTLKHLGLPGASVVHVGDSPKEDIDGAESAGVSGILLNRNAPSSEHSISALTELSGLLEEAW